VDEVLPAASVYVQHEPFGRILPMTMRPASVIAMRIMRQTGAAAA
jgi:hypothetical protein